MPRLLVCPGCQAHARSSEHTCPHCGAPLPDPTGRITTTAAAALLGLLPVACDPVPMNSHYGVPETEIVPPPPGAKEDVPPATRNGPAPDADTPKDPTPPTPDKPATKDKDTAPSPKPATDPMLEPAYGAVAAEDPMPSTAPAPKPK